MGATVGSPACPSCGSTSEGVIVGGTPCQVLPDRYHREARWKFDREAAPRPPHAPDADDAAYLLRLAQDAYLVDQRLLDDGERLVRTAARLRAAMALLARVRGILDPYHAPDLCADIDALLPPGGP